MTPDELVHFRCDVLGWSQSRLAGALGVPVNTWARWERGVVYVQHPTILRLALERLVQLAR